MSLDAEAITSVYIHLLALSRKTGRAVQPSKRTELEVFPPVRLKMNAKEKVKATHDTS